VCLRKTEHRVVLDVGGSIFKNEIFKQKVWWLDLSGLEFHRLEIISRRT
jgi:hypothetical protein